MFCIRSDVITLRSIEMYGLVTVWMSMDDGSYWVILLMYGSHDMRHTGFHRLTVVNGALGFWGVTISMCEGVGEDSRHVIGHVDNRVGIMNSLECVCLPLHEYLDEEQLL